MTIQDKIKQIKKNTTTDKEALMSLLCVCADMGSSRGVLLSVKKFGETAEMILEYFRDKG